MAKELKLTHLPPSGRSRMVGISSKADSSPPEDARVRLVQLFRRNGYCRVPRDERREQLRTKYKKGWEVRLVLKDEAELDEAGRLLARAGLNAGSPFRKASQWVQPVYGKKAVETFESWIASEAGLADG